MLIQGGKSGSIRVGEGAGGHIGARRGGAAGEGDRYDGAVWCVDLYDDHFDSSSAVDEGGDLRRKHHIGRGWLRGPCGQTQQREDTSEQYCAASNGWAML